METRIPKSLFVLLACGLLAFGALVMLVRMPRVEEEEPSSTGALTRSVRQSRKNVSDGICKSTSCLKTAYTLLDSMNTNVQPCTDFYEYACGGWIKKNPIPPSVSKWSPFGKLDMENNKIIQEILKEPIRSNDPSPLKQAKDFYKACSDIPQLNKVGLKPVLEVIQLYGGWPILMEPGSWNASNFNWMRSFADLKRMFGTSALFDIVVNQNPSNPLYSTIHLQQPSLFLSRPYFVYKSSFPQYISAYKNLIVDIVKEFKTSKDASSFPQVSSPINLPHIQKKAQEIVDFEEQIARLMRDGVEVQYGLRNSTATLALFYLQTIFDNYTNTNTMNKLELKKVLEYTFLTSGAKISSSQLISMSDTNFMGNMFELLSNTSSETLANYLHFRMMSWVVSGTTSGMRNHIQKYQNVVYGITEASSRDYVCSSSAEEKFGLAFTHPYLRKVKMEKDVVRNAGALMEQLRISFISLLTEIKWMNGTVKESLKRKARKITSCIGYAPWMSPTGSQLDKDTYAEHLKKHFKGLEIGSGSYLQKLWSVRVWLTDQKLKTLSEPFVSGCKWSTYPGVIGAFYDIRRQAVSVPLGLLQPPFFYPGIPDSINYGGLGSVLGHEFSHAFTVSGWTETPEGGFSPVSKCLIEQYSRFKVPEMNNLHINGALTLDENFPDNGGLLEAYTTFKSFSQPNPQSLPGLEYLSQEQLFFLGFANIWCASSRREGLVDQVLQDHHTPNRYRVVGSLQNSQEFADAWNCPSGSLMNPKNYKKCSAF